MSWDGSRAIGAAAAVLGIVVLAMARGLPEGTETGGPGTRFLPALLGVLMILLGGMIALGRGSARATEAGAGSGAEAGALGPGRAVVTVALMGAYALFLDRLGFLLATTALVAVLVRMYGERRWVVALGVAVGATATAYGLFASWLKVPLPPGLLGP